MEVDGDLDVFARAGEVTRPDVAQAQAQRPPLVGHIEMGDGLIRQHIVVIAVARFTPAQAKERAVGGLVGDVGCVRAVPPAQLMVTGARFPGAIAIGCGIIDGLPGGAVEVFALPDPVVAEADTRAPFRGGERKSGPLHLHHRRRLKSRRRRRIPVDFQRFPLLQLVAERQRGRDRTAARNLGAAQPDAADGQRVRPRVQVDCTGQRLGGDERAPAQTARRKIARQGQAGQAADRLRRLAGILQGDVGIVVAENLAVGLPGLAPPGGAPLAEPVAVPPANFTEAGLVRHRLQIGDRRVGERRMAVLGAVHGDDRRSIAVAGMGQVLACRLGDGGVCGSEAIVAHHLEIGPVGHIIVAPVAPDLVPGIGAGGDGLGGQRFGRPGDGNLGGDGAGHILLERDHVHLPVGNVAAVVFRMMGHPNRRRVGQRRSFELCRLQFGGIVVRLQVVFANDGSVGGVVKGGADAAGFELIEAEPVAASGLPARVVTGDAFAHASGGALDHVDLGQADRLRARGNDRYRHQGAVRADAGPSEVGAGAFQHSLPVYGQSLKGGRPGESYIARQPVTANVQRGKRQPGRQTRADNVEEYTE